MASIQKAGVKHERTGDGQSRSDEQRVARRRDAGPGPTRRGHPGGPFKDALNDSDKFVASSNPATKLEWPNSTLLHGDVSAVVAELKQRSRTNLVIMGSGVLIASLMAADVIDEYLLMIAPVVLGAGRRLFPEGVRATLRLTEAVATGKGVVLATYQAERSEGTAR